jgi:hypothetical protein
MVEALVALSAARDLFVTTEMQPIDFYLPYIGKRRTVSVDMVSATIGASAPTEVRRLVGETTAAGGSVWVYPCADPDSARLQELVAPLTIEPLPIEADGCVPAGVRICRAVAPASHLRPE